MSCMNIQTWITLCIFICILDGTPSVNRLCVLNLPCKGILFVYRSSISLDSSIFMKFKCKVFTYTS